MHKVQVNGKLNFDTDSLNGITTVNNQVTNADIRQLAALSYHVIYNSTSYNVEVVSLDKATKMAEIKVNGNTYRITAKDQFDLLLDQLGMSDQNTSRVSEIKAPMPGLVLKVFVAEGDVVNKGDNLFILEAMKMENIIKAPADVTIKSAKIKAGDKVEKGQVLMLF